MMARWVSSLAGVRVVGAHLPVMMQLMLLSPGSMGSGSLGGPMGVVPSSPPSGMRTFSPPPMKVSLPEAYTRLEPSYMLMIISRPL